MDYYGVVKKWRSQTQKYTERVLSSHTDLSDNCKTIKPNTVVNMLLFQTEVVRRVTNKDEKQTTADIAFKLFDVDRDGFITRDEFTQVCM